MQRTTCGSNGDTNMQIRSWMTDFVPLRFAGVSEDTRLGLADKVSKRVHFQGAVQIYEGTQRRQKAALTGLKG